MSRLGKPTHFIALCLLVLVPVIAVSPLRPTLAQYPDDVVASISVPGTVEISSDATARDEYGHGFAVYGGEVEIGSPGDSITVPVSAHVGWTLESLADPVTGITITRNDDGSLLRIPITDAEGNDTIRVLVNSTDYIGNGDSATATITSMSVDLPTRSRDLSDISPEVGVASVKILGQITGYPGDSSMDMSIAKSPDAATLETVESVAAEDGFELVDIAYVVGLDKTNLDHVLGQMTLQLTVGKAWYDSHLGEDIKVVRIADDGTTQVFEWEPVDPEADPVQFNLVSPDGLSRFVIEALRRIEPTATPSPTSTPTPESTATPVVVPTSSPTATPSPTIEPPPSPSPTPQAAQPTATSAIPTMEAPNATAPAQADGQVTGGNCSAPGGGKVAIGNIGLLSVAIGLVISRRKRHH